MIENNISRSLEKAQKASKNFQSIKSFIINLFNDYIYDKCLKTISDLVLN